ncbi:putative aBC transporter membrane-spanning protein [Mycobacterium kansasii]|uniref:Putative aBC transporter membrane-spanning protein n=1 Tax=Mycobacterium kansasii TaxID=1768 RepID=A0A1V3XHE9_MYCKA|nr:putative aBC transporter membrane-spanning protein [Mycobacterium kansasii]
MVLPLWVLLLSVPLATVYVSSIEKVYPAQQDRAGFAASIAASPAQRALYGQVYNDSLGAVGLWKAGMFHTLIAVAVILTVIRHTRADEETGRAELIESTSVGRYASLSAALLLSFSASIATGAIGAAGLLTTKVAPAGSLAFGAALAGSGLVFTAVAAAAAQLSPSARVTRVSRSPCSARCSRFGPSVTPDRARCPGFRRWGGHFRSGPMRGIAGGCCYCIWRRPPR